MWGTEVEIETKRRVSVSVWAYAYEFLNTAIVPDYKFDEECSKINLFISTTRPDLDSWFTMNFSHATGQWVHNHPEKEKLDKLARRLICGVFSESTNGKLD